jgi:hypothetical protein
MGLQARRVMSGLLLVSLTGVGIALAQPPAPGGPPPAGPGERGPGGGREGQPGAQSVERMMKGMNRSLRQLRDQIADATKKDENLRLIGEMERTVATVKLMGLPADMLAQANDDAAKAKMTTAFRTDLIGALRKLLDIEQDIADGKGESARGRLDELIALRDAAHKELGVSDDEKPGQQRGR